MKILRNQQFRIGYCKQAIAHAFRSLLLELHLRVTVGTLQERRIAVTGEVCDRVFVHALMQKLFGTTGIAGGFLYTISPGKPSDDGLPGLRVSADYDFVSSCSCSFFSSADCFARMALTL